VGPSLHFDRFIVFEIGHVDTPWLMKARNVRYLTGHQNAKACLKAEFLAAFRCLEWQDGNLGLLDRKNRRLGNQ
jgi:hypothetical protein